jgi:hypothetical protein
MANNPFDPERLGLLGALSLQPSSNSLLAYIGTPVPALSPMARTIAGLLTDTSTPMASTNPLSNALGLGNMFGSNALVGMLSSEPPSLTSSQPPLAFGSSLANVLASTTPPALYVLPPKPKPVAPETKRRVFFSFHFDDIMRVNNVRNAWKITHADSSSNRSFYDSSLWEARKITKPDVIKQLIRSRVLHTSAVCILAGSNTWSRRWVKYEIARAIIDGRGLLTVHLNSIPHHQTKAQHTLGRNPLAHFGVAKLQPDKLLPPRYYLYEMTPVSDGYGGVIEQWGPYGEYTLPVKKPDWLADPSSGYVMPLSVDAAEHDYMRDHGHRNIGSWIDTAAKQAGR